jgi:hypothetical protein
MASVNKVIAAVEREVGEFLEIPEVVARIPVQEGMTRPLSDNCVNVEFGVRLSSFAYHWRTVTADDPLVLDTVANWFIIKFFIRSFSTLGASRRCYI